MVELIIVITLISIFITSMTNLNFTRLSVKQEQAIFTNDLITRIETVRNYAFQWKGIWVNLDIPNEWNIEISSILSGSLLTTYSGSISGSYDDLSFEVESSYQIKDLKCKSIDGATEESLGTSSGILRFIWDRMLLSWCSDNSLRILEFTTQHANHTDIIEINTINSVIQKR